MSLRPPQLVLGPLPAIGLSDSIDPLPAKSRSETNILSQFRQKFLSDEALAERLRSGDADAMTVLFERHGPPLLGIARRILRNGAEAEDAVQQIFLDALRAIEHFDPKKGRFQRWLFMFGYQRIFNCRRSIASSLLFGAAQFDELSIGLQNASIKPASFPLPETIILIDQVLGQLQPRQRRTVEAVYFEGLTAEEISNRTGESVRVVRHNLYRGIEKLRKAVRGATATGTDTPKGGPNDSQS
jgi:RNA polymerase sigma-70 factor, ECF subfamily